MNLDLLKTQHYTTKAAQICENLIEYIPADASLVEPFVGNGDLMQLFPNREWEIYDVDPRIDNTIKQDTLLNPPNYKGKWVITNPPYLAKNKAEDKTLFNRYNIDDLYKISIKTILESDGGILIIPTNFFTDERTDAIRKEFLSRFKILKLNIFTTPVFDTTTYSVCSFVFARTNEDIVSQIIPTIIYPNLDKISIKISNETGYRLAGDFYKKVDATESIFKRLLANREVDGQITNIKLYAIDTRNERIRLEFNEDHFYGKNTDRTYATFVCSKQLTNEEQKQIVDGFNKVLEQFRERYSDLSMTNYRDYNRKRISFDFAYRLASLVAESIIQKPE